MEATNPEQPARIAQQFGGRRYAHNWALAQVKANLDARAADPAVAPLEWSLYDLRRAWNQAKQQVAPWWPACSKEAYASGIADLVAALNNWSESKHGRRAGPRVGFPRFKARHKDRGRVRFTTGAMRLEADRRHLVLPVIGRLRSKENTRRLERLATKGRARILSMTLAEHGGRLVVSVQAIVVQQPRIPSQWRGPMTPEPNPMGEEPRAGVPARVQSQPPAELVTDEHDAHQLPGGTGPPGRTARPGRAGQGAAGGSAPPPPAALPRRAMSGSQA